MIMSLTRATNADLCNYIIAKSTTLLGNRYPDCRLVCAAECGYKQEKYEPRILAISKLRIFILLGKSITSLKVDRVLHILSIRALHLSSENEMCVGLDETVAGKRRLYVRSETSSKEIACHILGAIKHYFPDCGPALSTFVELVPTELYSEFNSIPCSRPLLACHSFRRSYAALCDYYEQPFRDEVVWDVERIYALHHIRTLRLDDFTHLLPRDLIPILGVCQYSSFFIGILIEDIKLYSELIDVLLSVVKHSQSLSSLILRNCALPRDFIAMFANALHSNVNIPLEQFDFSGNILEDKKGFHSLSSILPRIKTLKSITLSECMLSEKCVHMLSCGLCQCLTLHSTVENSALCFLNLSGNTLRDEPSDLLHLLSLCTSLRYLDLSDTGINVNKLWHPLMFGGLRVETLKLARCQGNRRCKESALLAKKYFSAVVGLSLLDFSHTPLHSDLFKGLLLGLSGNQQLKPITLILDGACDKNSVPLLEAHLRHIDACSFSLRENSFESDIQSVISSLSAMAHLTHLNLSGLSFTNLKRGNKFYNAITNFLVEIVKLIGEDDSRLQELILSDCRIGSHLSVLLNTLGVVTSLKLLDITGNEIGNFGARLLAKALLINVSLKTLLIDRNQITGEGFAEIGHAVQLNTTLTSIPYPVIDVAECLNRADRHKALASMADIEASIRRNLSNSCKNKALQQSFPRFLQEDISSGPGSVDYLGILGDKLSVALDSLYDSSSNPSSVSAIIEKLINELEAKASSVAKVLLSPLKRVADEEGIGSRTTPVDFSPLKADLRTIISDYFDELKWKTINAFAGSVVYEYRKKCGNDGKASSGSWLNDMELTSSEYKSDSFLKVVEKLHRPKSVVTDFCVLGGEAGILFDSPPSGSNLSHVSKTRPKPPRNSGSSKSYAVNIGDAGDMAQSLNELNDSPDLLHISIDDSAEFSSSNLGFVCDVDSPDLPESLHFKPTRKALIPNFVSPNINAYSDRMSYSSSLIPPVVPQRRKAVPFSLPPLLPPKPSSKTSRPLSFAAENQCSGDRRSVADMTRMFSSVETAFNQN